MGLKKETRTGMGPKLVRHRKLNPGPRLRETTTRRALCRDLQTAQNTWRDVAARSSRREGLEWMVTEARNRGRGQH